MEPILPVAKRAEHVIFLGNHFWSLNLSGKIQLLQVRLIVCVVQLGGPQRVSTPAREQTASQWVDPRFILSSTVAATAL